MSKVQLRLYLETDAEDGICERQVLRYVEDMFYQERDEFEKDCEERGHKLLMFQSRLEHGW